MTLAAAQRLFWEALEGRADAGSIDQTFVGTAALSAEERIGVYQDMYLQRLVEALHAEFPALAGLLGEAAFMTQMEAYCRAFPSESPDLGQLGRELPRFLGASPSAVPASAELAALEWARAEVFGETHAPALSAAVMAAVESERMPTVRLQFIPALRLLSFERDPLPLWEAVENGRPPPPFTGQPAEVVVWRTGFEVFHARLADAGALGLRFALAGRPLAGICEAFAGSNEPVASAFAAIAGWFNEGWITAVLTGD